MGLTHVLTPAGGVAAEFSVARVREACAYLTSAAAAEEMDFDLLQARAEGLDVTVANVTEERAVIGLMAASFPRCTGGADATGFGALAERARDHPGRRACSRLTGCPMWASWAGSVHVARGDAAALFLALEAAGQAHGIGYYGAYAANAMRLEKGYRGWGSDLTTERTPTGSQTGVSGRGRRSGLHRARGNAGAARGRGLGHGSAGDRGREEVDPFYAHPVYAGDQVIGVVTSGAYGHRTGKVLALAYLRDKAEGRVECGYSGATARGAGVAASAV